MNLTHIYLSKKAVNTDEYYIYDNVEDYIEFLKPFTEITEYRYYVEQGFIDYYTTDIYNNEFKYIIFEFTKNSLIKEYRFFKIKDFEVVNTYIRYYIENDIFADNIANICVGTPAENTSRNFLLKRSSRNFNTLLSNTPVGFYDNIENCDFNQRKIVTRSFYDVPISNNLTHNYCIVGVFNFNFSQTTITTEENFSQIQSFVYVPDANEVLALSIAKIRGIKNVYFEAPVSQQFETKLLKLYVIEKNMIDINTSNSLTFQSSIYYEGIYVPTTTENLTLYTLNVGNIFEKEIDIKTICSLTDEDISNNKFYFGTIQNGIELQRKQNNLSCRLTVITNEDGINVYVSQGEKQYDLTENFTVGVTSNEGTFTTLEKIGRGLSFGETLLQASSGKLFNALTNTVNNFTPKSNASYHGTGDGRVTYGLGGNPWRLAMYKSNENIYKICYLKNGFNCNVEYSNFKLYLDNTSINSEFAVKDAQQFDLTPFYVQGDFQHLAGNKTDTETMSNLFSNGLYLIDLRGYKTAHTNGGE